MSLESFAWRITGPIDAAINLAINLLIPWYFLGWTGSVPLYLQPYDVVFIPNTPIDAVAIWVDNHIRRMIPVPYVISSE